VIAATASREHVSSTTPAACDEEYASELGKTRELGDALSNCDPSRWPSLNYSRKGAKAQRSSTSHPRGSSRLGAFACDIVGEIVTSGFDELQFEQAPHLPIDRWFSDNHVRRARNAEASATINMAMTSCMRLAATGYHDVVGGTRRHQINRIPIWYVNSAPTYANPVMYANVNAGQRQLFVSRRITASVAAH
jgi:hypothetical protein